jgi:hypothetical protein
VTGRIDTGRAVRNREYQLDETRLDKEQIVNLSITYCKTIVNKDSYFVVENADVDFTVERIRWRTIALL